MSGKSLSQQQSSTAQQFNIVLPVGVAADVQRVLELILPDLPVEDRPLVWAHGIQGPQADGDPYRVMARRAWWRRPFSWKRHGFAVTDYGLMLRRGNLWRKLAVFPLARLQGISAQQGPIDRLQRVGYLKAHNVAGPVLGEVVGIESAIINESLGDIARRASAAVQRDHGHRWAVEESREA
jgi:putative membrane protein